MRRMMPRRALKKSFSRARRAQGSGRAVRGLSGAGAGIRARIDEAEPGWCCSRVEWEAPRLPLYAVWAARRWPIGLRLTSAAAQLACSRPLALPM